MLPGADVIETSMETQQGVSDIKQQVTALVYGGKVSQKNSVTVTNVRHKDILRRVSNSISDGIEMTRRGVTNFL